jgi:hypothetical protein
MKITYTILTLLTLGFLNLGAYADNGPYALAVVQDGHGGSHFMYYQAPADSTVTVALETDSGGVSGPVYMTNTGVLADNGQVRYVIGTNQHGNANAAYIPVSSHFAQGQQ